MMSTAAGSPEPPWLLLPPSIDGSGRLVYKFHRVAEKKEEEFRCQNKMDFPEDIGITRDVDFAGSSHEWLALFNRRNYDLHLLNPITDRNIQLPPLPLPRPRTFGGVGVVERVILSSSPDQKSCQSFLTFGGKAALCSPRRSSEWTLFPSDRVYDDLVYSSTHGRLFCVTRGSVELECWDASDESSPRLDWVIRDKEKLDFGDLFLVVRHVNIRAGQPFIYSAPLTVQPLSFPPPVAPRQSLCYQNYLVASVAG